MLLAGWGAKQPVSPCAQLTPAGILGGSGPVLPRLVQLLCQRLLILLNTVLQSAVHRNRERERDSSQKREKRDRMRRQENVFYKELDRKTGKKIKITTDPEQALFINVSEKIIHILLFSLL